MLNIRNIFRNKARMPEKTVNAHFKVDKNTSAGIENSTYLNNRLGQIYGEESIRLQLLYENWAVKESWLLMDEAIPLLAGFDPALENNYEQDIKTSLDEIWMHAKGCVEQGLLRVINREDAPEKWRALPVDIYRWARTSRIRFPDVLANLMEFISSTTKHTAGQGEISIHHDHADLTAMKFDQDRERVLGIALAILAAYPEKCRNNRGQIRAGRIVNLINEKAAHWTGNEEIKMSPVAMNDLINKWLKTINLQTD